MTSPALQPIPLPPTASSPSAPTAPELVSPPAPPANTLMFSPKLTNNLFSSPPLTTQPLPDPSAAPAPAQHIPEPVPEQPAPAPEPETRPDPPVEEQPATAEPAPAPAAPVEPAAAQTQPVEPTTEDQAETETGVVPATIERQAEEDEIIAEQFSNEYHDILVELPAEYERNFKLLRELENQQQDTINQLKSSVLSYVTTGMVPVGTAEPSSVAVDKVVEKAVAESEVPANRPDAEPSPASDAPPADVDLMANGPAQETGSEGVKEEVAVAEDVAMVDSTTVQPTDTATSAAAESTPAPSDSVTAPADSVPIETTTTAPTDGANLLAAPTGASNTAQLPEQVQPAPVADGNALGLTPAPAAKAVAQPSTTDAAQTNSTTDAPPDTATAPGPSAASPADPAADPTADPTAAPPDTTDGPAATAELTTTTPAPAPAPAAPPKPPRPRDAMLALLASATRAGEDKIGLAHALYDTVDRHIRRLDADLAAAEDTLVMGLRAGTLPSHDVPSLSLKDVPGATTSRVAIALGEQAAYEGKGGEGQGGEVVPGAAGLGKTEPGGGLHGAAGGGSGFLGRVDPNEPVFCYCQRVSFGEMIGCENDDCPRQWFHLACVGLSEAPKDDWWCPDCRKLLPETAMKRSASQPGDKKKKKRRRIFS